MVFAYISCDLINSHKDEHIPVIHHPFTRQRHQAAEYITECNQRHSDKDVSKVSRVIHLYVTNMQSDIRVILSDWW